VGRRIATRRRLAVPLSVTVLRSGVPDAVPGRSIDVCEGGVGAVLAAELFPGELVGVEFELPHTGPVLAKARVCYQERLRYGLQFLAIPPEQRAMIEFWASANKERAEPFRSELKTQEVQETLPVRELQGVAEPTLRLFGSAVSERSEPATPRYLRRKIVVMLIASVIVVVGLGWWRWEQAWQELESRLPGRGVVAAQARVTVPAEEMQRLLIHKVDPISPDATGKTRTTGLAVLDAVVGPDGSVVSLRPVRGPDILTRAAMDSVQWWKFEPYRVNGQPVEVQTTVAVEFQ
jgi:outer membrane biosynthesis protein TonB